MPDSEEFRRRAEALLREASAATNMAERSKLIDEAVHWHSLAMDAAGHPDPRRHDNDEDNADRAQSA
jgi:hypothetical protein